MKKKLKTKINNPNYKKEDKKEVQNKIQKDNSKLKTFFNKNKPFVIGSIIFLVLLLILLAVQFNSTGKVITGYDPQTDSTKSFNILNNKGLGVLPAKQEDVAKVSANPAESNEIIKAKWSYNGKQDSTFGTILGIIFGDPVIVLTQGAATNVYSGMVIVIAVWILLFVTFSDIIGTFSTFNKGVSWVIGFLIATISAQMNFLISVVSFLAKTFAALGSLAVFVGLGAAFLAFLAVNLGLTSLRKFIIKRRMMKTIAYGEVGKGMMTQGAKTLIELATTTAQEGKKVQERGI
jgi:hypothetical protein